MRLALFSIIGAASAFAPVEAAAPAQIGDMDPESLQYEYPPTPWKYGDMAVVALIFDIAPGGTPVNIHITRIRYAVRDQPVEEIPLDEALSGLPAHFMAGADRLVRKLHFDAASAGTKSRTLSIAFLLGTCDQIPHEEPVDYFLTICRSRPPEQRSVR